MSEAFWALGRASGIVLLVLMTVTLLLGIVTRSGRPLPGLPRFAVLLSHRNLSLLSVVFLAVHVGTLLLDPYAQLTLVDLVVPFLGAASPLALGLGTLSLDLVVAVTATALLRRWLGRGIFRAVHWAAYAMWPMALLHGIAIGSDGRSAAFLALAVASAVAVGAASVWRLTTGFVEYRRMRTEPVS